MRVIDVHTHGIGGFDTRTDRADDVLAMAAIHGSCGVSEIIPTIYAADIHQMRTHMEAVRKAMEAQDAGCKMLDAGREKKNPRPSRIIGVHLEGPFLNPIKCGALDAPSFSQPDARSLRELLEGFEDIVKIMTVAPEIKGAINFIKDISNMGIVVSMGHSDATYAEAEDGYNAGARGITHIFNAMRGFHHREPGIAGFGLLNKDIYIEVIADPCHLHPKTLEFVFEIKNRDRIVIVSDTVGSTGTGAQKAECVKDSSGRLLGGSMTITQASQRLIQLGYDEEVIIDCISSNPERYLSAG